MRKTTVAAIGSLGMALCAAGVLGQPPPAQRPASPMGQAATQVGGRWVSEKSGEPPRYVDGKWVEIVYGRPIRRQRDGLFGSGAEYGVRLNDGAPVWRAGANQTTRLKTEAPLEFAGTRVDPGEWALMVDLKANGWTLILSRQKWQENFDPNEKVLLFGSLNHDPAQDVLRAPMKLEKLPYSVDQLTIGFIDVTQTGGTLAIWWDREFASVPFSVALPRSP